MEGPGGLRSIKALTDVLREFGCLVDPGPRSLCLDLMADELPAVLGIRHHHVTSYFLPELARICLDDTRALRILYETLVVMGQSQRALRRLGAVIHEVTARPALPGPSLDELRPLLDGLEVPALGHLCRLAAGPFQSVPPLDDPWVAFETLSHMNAQPDGLPPALALIEHLAAEASRDRADALRAWADGQAQALGLTAPQRELRQRVVHSPPPAPVDAYLVVQLLPQDDSGGYLLTAWRQFDPEGWRPVQTVSVAVAGLEAAERIVQDLVWDAVADWAGDAETMHLEFMLSTDDLAIPVQHWRQEIDSDYATPLCVDHPVVVRSLERSETRRWHRPWKQRWRLLENEPGRASPMVIEGPPDASGTLAPAVLEARIKADPTVVAAVLSAPPSTERGALEARAAWRAGLPIVVWDRRAERHPEVAHRLDGNLAALRESVTQLRLDALTVDSAAERERHLGSHISLVWDDPTRPVQTRGRLAGPD
ncbi:hypothetical protein D7319_00730 [Streptomyces radicis]|uniref:Uncharacterized protein n=1 Tax=Streptomyces radicis TaxID=1750517 RepID=A0A3A9WJA0_9ACTN|nr:hypothetical protein D7319_00730 [Streptomyces radicis]RKN27877.1 hypothetical protein D7318_02165 [Streptomyces radicis]